MFMRTAVLLLAAALLQATSLGAQTAEELIVKNLKAKGGIQKLKSIQAMRITGKVSPAPNVQIPMTMTTERPNKMRQESAFEGKAIVTAFDGETAWTINPMMGIDTAREVPKAQLELIKGQADFDGPFVDYKGKGITIELVGRETIDGLVPAHKLKVTRKDGSVQHLYLDVNTGLEIKAINEIKQAEGVTTVESSFSNYQPIEGLVIAHQIVQKVSGPQTAQVVVTIDKVEILPDVDDSVFRMPAKPSQ
jgi:outer membrane lipoprotein-sorting protein